MKLFDKSVYLVSDRSLSRGRSLSNIVKDAVEGGVSMVQLREKNCSTIEFYHLAIELKKCLKPYGIPLIINDRLDIALACDAEGVHIGNSDLPFPVVRRLLGSEKIIGLSVESIGDAKNANDLDVDYIGVSPVFSTLTKVDTAPAIGLGGLREISRISKHPIVAIGGINESNAKRVIEAGADAIALVSAIMSATSPRQMVKNLLNSIRK